MKVFISWDEIQSRSAVIEVDDTTLLSEIDQDDLAVALSMCGADHRGWSNENMTIEPFEDDSVATTSEWSDVLVELGMEEEEETK
jgi:hypothetical protein